MGRRSAGPMAWTCAAVLGVFGAVAVAQPADLVLVNGRVTTQALEGPGEVEALAVRGGLVAAIGSNEEAAGWIGGSTVVIDAGGRRVVPGLNDSHLHATRAGRFYAAELRWDGVGSLSRGLAMVREQALRTPAGQWVRVVGGWSPHQFVEGRAPTPAELTEAAPETPVFVLQLYSRGYLNRAGVAAMGLSERTATAPGTRIEITSDGGAILHAEPSPGLLYGMVAALPGLSAREQELSSRHFYRELNRFGITSVVDPGGGGHLYPTDYRVSEALAVTGRLTVRVGNYLFATDTGKELAQYRDWTARELMGVNRAMLLLRGYTLEGAGENLVASAADYENFLAPRPELGAGMEADLRAVVEHLVRMRWPIRIHATYEESIRRMLDVFEAVDRDLAREIGVEGRPGAGLGGLRIVIDHGETMSGESVARLRALGGGVAVQSRMAYAGEEFVERYGAAAGSMAPPLRLLVESGVALGAGSDGTRVGSYNPWETLEWLVTGRTVGGLELYGAENRLSREEALRLHTVGSAWFSGDESVKGRLTPGQYADFAVLSEDYFEVEGSAIGEIESLLTVVGGRCVWTAGALSGVVEVPELAEIEPAWSPVRVFGGYQRE